MNPRPILKWTLIAAAALAVPVYLGVSVFTAEPVGIRQSDVDAMNALIAEELSQDGNAAPAWAEIAEEWALLNEEWTFTRSGGRLDAELNRLSDGALEDPRLAVEREAFAFVRPLLAKVRQAAEAPRAVAPFFCLEEREIFPGGLFAVDRRHIESALRHEMRLAAARGDWEEAGRVLRDILRLCDQARSTPSGLVWGLSGSCEAWTTVQLSMLLHELRPSAAQIAAMLVAMGPPEPPTGDTALLVQIDIERHISDFGRWFDASGREVTWLRGERLYYKPTLSDRLSNIRALVAPRRRTYERQLRALVPGLQQAAASSPLHPLWDQLTAEFESIEWPRGHAPFDPVGSIRRLIVSRVGAHPAYVLLRIHLFRAEQGRWPESLAEVVEPADTIVPSTGLPYEYRVLANDPEGRGFSLIAVTRPWEQKDRPTRFVEYSQVREPLRDEDLPNRRRTPSSERQSP